GSHRRRCRRNRDAHHCCRRDGHLCRGRLCRVRLRHCRHRHRGRIRDRKSRVEETNTRYRPYRGIAPAHPAHLPSHRRIAGVLHGGRKLLCAPGSHRRRYRRNRDAHHCWRRDGRLCRASHCRVCLHHYCHRHCGRI